MAERSNYLIKKECIENFDYIKDTCEKNHSYPRGKLRKLERKYIYRHQTNSFGGLFLKKISIQSYSIILFFIISFSILSQILASNKFETRGLATNNFIVLTIEGQGYHTIINEDFTSLLSSIQINNEIELNAPINSIQNLNSGTNTIKMFWSNPLNSCKDMFKNLTDIISIDLTNFDFSSVIYMESFFEECTSLKSVEFGNNNALNALNMNYMFKNCISILSVNFKNFQVNKMKNLEQMFFGCENITSIDLSSFDTPDLLYLSNIFNGCKSLTYKI